MITQKDWRKDKRVARKSIILHEKIIKNQQIAEKVITSKDYQQSTNLGVYLFIPEEVDVKSIIEAAWTDGKKVYLPVVIGIGKALKFAPYSENTKLKKDCLGIDIPDLPDEQLINANELDMVVTPLVAFDENCNRIGMGGGFYDRTFAFKKANPQSTPTLIGVAFEIQKVDGEIVSNKWDIRPDKIISEFRVY